MEGRIAQKWGFGMAPPKPETANQRNAACATLLNLLNSSDSALPAVTDELLSEIGTVKGLFNRVFREDQWDWFTVASQLGYPSRRMSRVIAQEINRLRVGIKRRDITLLADARVNLLRLPTRRCLAVHLGRARIPDESGAGWLYVLSTRESPELLKVGMTIRDMEQRVREINTATGVAIPFAVRRCWRVSNPRAAEKLAHQTLREFRLRDDREFFQLPFRDAVERLDNAIRQSHLEIRTLDRLAGLAGSG